MKPFFLTLFFLSSFIINSQNTINYSNVAQDLLQNIMDKKSYAKEVSILSESTLKNLTDELQTDQNCFLGKYL